MAKKNTKNTIKKGDSNKSVPSVFYPIEYMKLHPANMVVVARIAIEIKKYIDSYCRNAKIPIEYEEWYVGISQDPDNARTSSHKNKKSLAKLSAYNKFRAYSFSNARTVEKILCQNFDLNHCNTIGKVTKETKYCYTYHLAGSPHK